MSKKTQVQERILEKATKDPGFRRRLVAEPKEAIAREFGVRFPSGVNVQVVEEGERNVCLVLPGAAGQGEELPIEELAAVAGGIRVCSYTTSTRCTG